MYPPPEEGLLKGLAMRALLRLGGGGDSAPPRLGKVLLATYAAGAGYSVAVEDGVLSFPSGLRRLRRQLARSPLAVGISTVAIMYPATLEKIVAAVRRYSPSSRIILGGLGVASYPDMRRLADLTVTGYGETALLRVLQTLKQGKDLGSVPGVERDGAGLLLKGDDFYESGRLLTPDWSYFKGASRRYTIEASRGCRFNCSFCTLPSHGRHLFRSPDEVLEEMSLDVERHGASHIDFVDSTFTGDQGFIDAFLDRLERSGLKVPWGCLSRVDDFARQPDLPARLARAGCVYCCIGLESVHDDVLRRMRKGYTRKIIEAGLSNIDGLYVQVNIIVGFPGDTRDKVRETADFLRRFPLKGIVVTPLFVPPALFAEAERNPELFCHLKGSSTYSWRHDTMNSEEAREQAAWLSREVRTFLPGR